MCGVVQPGSDMAKAEKLWAKRQRKLAARRARKRHLQQLHLRRQQRQAARRGERIPQVSLHFLLPSAPGQGLLLGQYTRQQKERKKGEVYTVGGMTGACVHRRSPRLLL